MRTRPRKVSRRSLSDSDDIRNGTVNDLTEGSMVVVSETRRCTTRTTETVMCEILPSKTPPGISCRCTSVPRDQCNLPKAPMNFATVIPWGENDYQNNSKIILIYNFQKHNVTG